MANRPSRGARLLAEWMTRKGLSQEKAAAKFGVGQTLVSLWLRGTSPRIESAVTIKRVAGIPIEAWADAEPATRRSA